MVKVSAVIPTIGRASLTDCLKSLKEQTYKDYEVIVVGLEKETEKAVSQFGFNFLLSPVATASKQRNLGIENAKGEIIAFIDDDAVADREWLSRLVKHYQDERVGCVGGRVTLRLLGEAPDFLKNLPPGIFKGFLGETLLDFDKATAIDKPLLWASNLSFRRNVLDKIGLFDEELGRSIGNLMGEEETELQRRILREGFKIVYEPNATVTHLVEKERLTKLWFLERSFWQGYSEILRVRKSKDFERLYGLEDKKLLFKYMSFIKFMEMVFEFVGSTTLEKEIESAKKIGRVAAFSSLIR